MAREKRRTRAEIVKQFTDRELQYMIRNTKGAAKNFFLKEAGRRVAEEMKTGARKNPKRGKKPSIVEIRRQLAALEREALGGGKMRAARAASSAIREAHRQAHGGRVVGGSIRPRKNPRGKGGDLRANVLKQLGGGEEALQSLRDVANHGAGGGFPGFTYTSDTVKFFNANEDTIMILASNLADDMGMKSVWELVAGFSQVPHDDLDSLKNSLAWLALEEIARGEEE